MSRPRISKAADELKAAFGNTEAHERMYYEAAWAYRGLAEQEVAAMRLKLQQDRQKAMQAEADKKAPARRRLCRPDVARSEVPVQPAEQKARGAYQSLSPTSATRCSIDARFELAEFVCRA